MIYYQWGDKMKRLTWLLVCLSLLISGCSSQLSDKELAAEAIRAESRKYDFLNNGYYAVTTLSYLFGIWNDDSYQLAKSKAKLASNLHGEWFGFGVWQGSEFLAKRKVANISKIWVESISDAYQYFVFEVSIQGDNYYNSAWYKATYSIASDEIISLSKIFG